MVLFMIEAMMLMHKIVEIHSSNDHLRGYPEMGISGQHNVSLRIVFRGLS